MTDAAAQAHANEIFDPVAAEYLARDGVDFGPMFGSQGLRIRGKVFAFVGHLGSLVVKLPEVRVDELESSGAGERMVIRDRAMREWAIIEPDRAESWAPLVDEAFHFVDGITP